MGLGRLCRGLLAITLLPLLQAQKNTQVTRTVDLTGPIVRSKTSIKATGKTMAKRPVGVVPSWKKQGSSSVLHKACIHGRDAFYEREC